MTQAGRSNTAYLAARYSRREELVPHKEALEDAGWEVTSRWLLGNHQAQNDDLYPGAAAERFALEDLDDLMRADVLIHFTEPPRQPSTSRGGRHVEHGYALAQGQRIIIVGPRENVFHCVGDTEQVDCFEEALDRLVTGVLA